jgi:hypothetical protein
VSMEQRLCRNRHVLPSLDWRGKCPECLRLSNKRRTARYYHAHKQAILARQKVQKREKRDRDRQTAIGW